MVTHDRYFLDRVCNKIIEIDNKQIYTYDGNYDYYLRRRKERIEAMAAELAKVKNTLRREQEWMSRQPQARAGKAKYRIDSFYELQGIIKEEENLTLKKAESQLLSIIKKQNKAQNKRGVHTTFLTIQQVTKSGAFIGSNRLKHMITAMMELRLDNPKNIYSDRYVTFSKHRRGDVGVKLYYNLSQTGDVFYDEERYVNDCKLRRLQSEVSSQLHEYADKFNKLFNNIKDDDK
jgi:hypothetical protein